MLESLHIMKRLFNTAFVILLVGLSPVYGDERTWTSSDGREIKAELVSYDIEAQLIVIKTPRKEFTLPFAKLSPKDQAFIKELAEKEKGHREADKKAAAGRAGTTTKEETEAGNSFHVYYPTSYSVTKKPPMLILFSPGGGGSGMLKNFRQGADALGWVLVGCDKLKNGMSDEEGKKIFGDLLPVIEKRVDHDPELLYMGGCRAARCARIRIAFFLSAPGKGSWLVAVGWEVRRITVGSTPRKWRSRW